LADGGLSYLSMNELNSQKKSGSRCELFGRWRLSSYDPIFSVYGVLRRVSACIRITTQAAVIDVRTMALTLFPLIPSDDFIFSDDDRTAYNGFFHHSDGLYPFPL